jgi:hypothetical protein
MAMLKPSKTPPGRVAAQLAWCCLATGAWFSGGLAALIVLYSVLMLFSGGTDPMTGAFYGFSLGIVLALLTSALAAMASSVGRRLVRSSRKND